MEQGFVGVVRCNGRRGRPRAGASAKARRGSVQRGAPAGGGAPSRLRRTADKICPKRRAAFVRICFRRENNAIAWVQRGIASRTLLAQIPSFIFHRRRACQDYFPMLTARPRIFGGVHRSLGQPYVAALSGCHARHLRHAEEGLQREVRRDRPRQRTFGMEAVARQFATNKKCLVIRNGWFSFRWSQIFDMGSIPSETTVLKARRSKRDGRPPMRRRRSTKWLPRSRNTSRIWCLRRTSKPRPG